MDFPFLKKRVVVICGHFGSGKTEFSVNYVMALAAAGRKSAIVDLDIANPYFRSRERQAELEAAGVKLYSNVYHRDITQDLPAITAEVRAPLEDESFHTVVDAGGDETGARILNQFRKYLSREDCGLYCVVNANRPETSDLEGALFHLNSIQEETGVRASGLINNTHMLLETTEKDIRKGADLCRAVEQRTGIPFVGSAVIDRLCPALAEDATVGTVFPIRLYMRPSWLDR